MSSDARVIARGDRPRLPATARLLAVVFLLSPSLACEHGVTLIDPEAADTTGTGGGNGVMRASLTVRVAVSEQDAAIAGDLGLAPEALPGVEVTIERLDVSEGERTAVSDESGEVRFEELLPGRYAVSGIRVLTLNEIDSLDETDGDVTGFGGGVVGDVEAPATEFTLTVVAGRRGSLVISEIHEPIAVLPSGNAYLFGHYVELYNNSDTTIFLDGKVLARGFIHGARGTPETSPCDLHEPWQNDPEGIWTAFIEAFPGSGRDFRLHPGQSAVVAIDAVDHSALHPELQDLSRADFEFIGSSDVDNPTVPNMQTLTREFGAGVGHGLRFGWTDAIVVLADSLQVASLVVDQIPGLLDPTNWRIPAEKILDVLTISPAPDVEAAQSFLPPQCAHYVNEVFDQQYVRAFDHAALDGIFRRPFTTLDGRLILQRTRNSSRDFGRHKPPTPSVVP